MGVGVVVLFIAVSSSTERVDRNPGEERRLETPREPAILPRVHHRRLETPRSQPEQIIVNPVGPQVPSMAPVISPSGRRGGTTAPSPRPATTQPSSRPATTVPNPVR